MGANAQTTVPTFTAAQVLTAAQMNDSARTGVPVFANTTARDAAFGGAGEKTLAEGQLCYLEDTNATQFYDGSVWQTVGGGSVSQLKWQSGELYLHPGRWSQIITATEDVTYYIPLFTPESVTLDRIQIRTASTFSGTASVRLGLYTNGTDGQPDTLILDAGTVAPTAASTSYSATISQAVAAGFFWMAFNMQTAAATSTFFGYNNLSSPEIAAWYSPRSNSNISFSNLGQGFAFQETGITGAFANAVSTTATVITPTIAVRTV